MSRRKLSALRYSNEAEFDPHDKSKLRQLIIWLEKMEIRQYKPEDRSLLTETQLPDWLEVFSTYLRDAGCPFSENEVVECVDWLLGYAVRLEYLDNAQDFSELSTETEQNLPEADDPFSLIDYNSPQFAEGVNRLAALLHIQPHSEDPKVTLRALAKYSEMYLSEEARKRGDKPGTPLKMSEIDLGFDVKDPTVKQAAKILRLLFIDDIRSLQTRINEAIVAVQSLTADPRTDSRLGRVGK